ERRRREVITDERQTTGWAAECRSRLRGRDLVFASGVFEAGVFGHENRLEAAGGAVALLGDDEFHRDGAAGALRLRVAVAVDEEDAVGVLLDGAGLAQVGKLRSPLALLHVAGKLGETEERQAE